MKKTFPLQLAPELHRRMKHASFDAGETLHDWIIQAIENRLGKTKYAHTDQNHKGRRNGKLAPEEDKTSR